MKQPEVKIALTGKLRSGKSMLEGYAALEYDFTPVDFSDLLKRTAQQIYGYEMNRKPRELFQKFGQICREIDPDVWVNALFRKLDLFKPRRVLISGVRQQNEYDRLKAEGYTIIRVSAPEELRIKRALELNDDFSVHNLTHATEMAIDSFTVDYEITNDKTVKDLCRKFDEIMQELGVTKEGEKE